MKKENSSSIEVLNDNYSSKSISTSASYTRRTNDRYVGEAYRNAAIGRVQLAPKSSSITGIPREGKIRRELNRNSKMRSQAEVLYQKCSIKMGFQTKLFKQSKKNLRRRMCSAVQFTRPFFLLFVH